MMMFYSISNDLLMRIPFAARRLMVSVFLLLDFAVLD